MHDAAIGLAHVEAEIGADPQASRCIRGKADHGRRTQAVGAFRIVLDALEAAVLAQAIEAAKVGADPDRAGAVFGNREHGVAAQAVRIGGVMPVAPEAAVSQQLVESAGLAAAPDASVAVDQQRRHVIAGQRGSVIRIMPPDAEIHAVVTRQAITRANPDETIAALAQGVDAAGGQAIGDAQQFEPRFRRWRSGAGARRQKEYCEEDPASSHAASPPRYAAMVPRAAPGRPAMLVLTLESGACRTPACPCA